MLPIPDPPVVEPRHAAGITIMLSKFLSPLKWHYAQARKNHSLELLFISLLTVAIRIPFTIATNDDAYITFRYARNLANGLGFVYNAGEQVLGTTTPLFTLFLAVVSKLGLDLIVVAKAVNLIAEAGTAVLIYILLREIGPRGLTWTGALLFILSTYNIHSSATGMETGLYTFFIMLTLFLYSRGRLRETGFSAGVLTLLRPDGLLVVAAIGLDWLLRRRDGRDAIKPLAIFLALLLPWILFATLYFGSPIPNSITAKALTYRAKTVWDWGAAMLNIFLAHGGWQGVGLIACLFLAGVFSLQKFEIRRRLLPYLLWLFLYVAVFTLARAGPYIWYYSPLLPVLDLFLALGGYALYQRAVSVPVVERTFTLMRTRALALLIVPVLIVTIGLSLYASWDYETLDLEFEQQVSLPVSLWLRANTPIDTVVAIESIGQVGWHSNRYILDEGGLVSKQSMPLNALTPGDINFLGILQTYRPDYLIAWETYELDLLQATPARRIWFEQNYSELNRYRGSGKTWILYQRR